MGSTLLVEKIEHLQAQTRSYRERRIKLTESDTIRVLILPLLAALGWDLGDLDEVKTEYRHKASDNPVDCALFLQRLPVLFVEAKALNERLDERKWLLQTLNYANGAGVDWCVLTNGDEYRIYKVHAPVEAEDKLFLTIRLDDEAPASLRAQQLALISRDRMRQRDIDALWTDWRIDRQVQSALETLHEDEAFIRFLARKTPGLTQGDVRGSLRRAVLRVDYPSINDLLDGRNAAGTQRARRTQPVADSSLMPQTSANTLEVSETDQADPIPKLPNGRRRPARTTELFELGLLKSGMKLSIKGHPDSEATVVDGRSVEYRGERLSYNVWGCRVTGWLSIQIYSQALMEDGQLLEALRRKANAADGQ